MKPNTQGAEAEKKQEYVAILKFTAQVSQDEYDYLTKTMKCTHETTIADIEKWALEQMQFKDASKLELKICSLD